MTGTDTFPRDGSRTAASSLEQNGHTYVENRITGSTDLFSCTWKSTTESDTSTQAKRILPDLCADFIVDSDGRSWLVGPATGADLVSVAAGTTMWGIRIKPPALRSLLGAAADAVQDSKIAFDDILTSRQARVLADALRHEAVDANLLDQLWRGLEPDYGIERGYCALIASPTTPVREIAADLGVSERHFRRSITSSVGLSPKLIQKVQRMQNALALSRSADLTLSSLACRAGYADQAHLARDTRALAGLTPTQLLREHR
ncbi:helix-turn-helix domain-containing protein [Rhodococcus sp. NPDC060176]|uniref:helix-turn-helix domain-containing protein n=1 Tax=Rhodococcus sp. NPDC060176 TaxID=3347062 RepID=UPI00364ACB88